MQNSERFQTVATDEARFRMLVESITDYAIYQLAPDGAVASWNAGARRFKGYEPAEIIGQNFSRFYTHEDRLAGLPQRILAIAAEKGTFQGEGWRVRKDGTRFWASVVIDPIWNSDGTLEGFAKITRDLTERKEAETSLRASEEQFRLLVQGVTDYAIYMLDPGGKVANWNMGAQRIKGYLPDEIIGEHFSRFYPEQDRINGEPARALATALREGRYEKEATRIRKDGTSFFAHVIIDPVHDNNGNLIGFAKITRDITERKQTQEALEKAQMVLMQSQKMDAIGQLTGGVAHDFNNLLMAISGSLELLDARLPDDPRMKRLLDNAMQGAKRGTILTQRMLSFARRQDMKTEAVDAARLVQDMNALLQSSISAGVHIESRFSMGLPTVLADPNQLELAILNLVTNARDAMPQGGKITIATRLAHLGPVNDLDLPDGDYVCLSVADMGAGMDEETLQKATEPFFTTKGVGKGTGLGLPMVHGMAEQMGGRFRLLSKKGEGTSAEIYLPVANMARAPEPVPVPEEMASVRPMLVVAVDDDGLVLLNTVAMLEELGHRVLEASSGAAALDLVRDNPVDLVITDQAMPGMTGADLADHIREIRPQMPVIVATGYAELPATTRDKLPILAKPFAMSALQRAIAQVIGH